MVRRRARTVFVAAASALVAALLAACAGGGGQAPDDAALCQAYRAGRSHVEVVADGTVVNMFGVSAGRTSPHEGFLMKLNSGCSVVVRVEANTDFTGTFPLARGDRVTAKGEYEFYPRGGVIHWTHRDPRGRHEGGYIQVRGNTYD